MIQTGRDMNRSPHKRLKELTVLLAEMKRLHEGLLSAARRKSEAMRRADTQAMEQAGREERALADRIKDQEGLRKVLMERIGERMGFSAPQARKMSISELARSVAEPIRTQLTVLGAELRKLASEIARLNRIAALVSQEMVRHFRAVYEAMTQQSQTGEFYGRTGRPQSGVSAAVIDTTG